MRIGLAARTFALALAFSLAAGLAHAGCPSTCDIEVPPVVVEPELQCLGVSARGTSCECDIEFELSNGCSDPVDLIDFQLTSCTVAGSTSREYDCVTLDPEQEGILFVKIRGNGHKDLTFQVNSAGTDHTIGVQADVKHFDGHPGACSLGLSRGTRSSGGAAWFWFFSSAALVLARRKCGRRNRKVSTI